MRFLISTRPWCLGAFTVVVCSGFRGCALMAAMIRVLCFLLVTCQCRIFMLFASLGEISPKGGRKFDFQMVSAFTASIKLNSSSNLIPRSDSQRETGTELRMHEHQSPALSTKTHFPSDPKDLNSQSLSLSTHIHPAFSCIQYACELDSPLP